MTPFDDPTTADREVQLVCNRFSVADPAGERAARVFRETFDQLYDGQRTGRYRWDQLYKTEKTHFGTLIEINLRREFTDVLADGRTLDYTVDGIEVDCKFSAKQGGWMIPPEALGKILLVSTASDQLGEWAMGVVRASPLHVRNSTNWDRKTNLSLTGRSEIKWIWWGEPLPPNVLLTVDSETQQLIFSHKSGQQRVNQLFRSILNRRIGRNTVATVAQQYDYMKRVRGNGGARSALASEGIIILSGDFSAQQDTARQLGATVPRRSEFVSLRVAPAAPADIFWTDDRGDRWRVAESDEVVAVDAPLE